MSNPQLDSLLVKAQVALRNKPPWGKSLCVDFGKDGVIYVYPTNEVAEIPNVASADCTLTLSLDALHKLMDGEKSAFGEWMSGELKYTGDRSVAQQFASIVTGK